MRVDLRVKHDVEARKAAIGLFELGRGYKSAAIALSLPAEAVRRWQEIYRAFGSEVLLRMDGKQGRYTYEQKVAAASAVVTATSDKLFLLSYSEIAPHLLLGILSLDFLRGHPVRGLQRQGDGEL
ncbi:hypothetical protein F3B21_24145 [Bacteroides fragilis]|nr:hypothetical protein F3B21_24145 [Bacteroides fragilis]